MKTKYLSVACAFALTALITSACGSGSTGGGDNETLRIAAVTALTGPLAQLGKDEVAPAIQFAVDEANEKKTLGDRKVKLTIIDTLSTTEGALAGTEKAIEKEDSPYILGMITSSAGIAVGNRIEQLDGLYISSMAKSPDLLGETCGPRVFRANKSDDMDARVVEPWLAEHKEGKWATLGLDYVWGRTSVGNFKKTAKTQGEDVTTELYAPQGTADYAPYIQQLMKSDATGLWTALSGTDLINFYKQAASFGLLDKFDTIIRSTGQKALLDAVGAPMVGSYDVIQYSPQIDTASNKEFVKGWKAKHDGAEPTPYEGETYVAMQVLLQAVKKADSVDPDAVSKALSGGTFETVFGTNTIRPEDNQLLSPTYVGQVNNEKSWDIVASIDAKQAEAPVNKDCSM